MRLRIPFFALSVVAMLMILVSACERRPHMQRAMDHAREQAKINAADFERNRERRLATQQQLRRQAEERATIELAEEDEP
ncbi:Sec-independent protein translocase protein TatA [Herbaspirillum sp. Sphag1AN]|uniref:hypothetical protein n=1 Tax=unclassified Herbaspirillum TaxID=2624150 RepID=UPI001620C63B|nr:MULTISPECIES: hypothetical protein [unclassified Herbaspirillum]MBB3212173.1 Sec-independent protein translocase protein TatA [Herbaspirillum sp. Sphag1AN]MBB3243993.1 Sec-independent protein translocase protein TatA [Herbaspirillum sp. Sphag64]